MEKFNFNENDNLILEGINVTLIDYYEQFLNHLNSIYEAGSYELIWCNLQSLILLLPYRDTDNNNTLIFYYVIYCKHWINKQQNFIIEIKFIV